MQVTQTSAEGLNREFKVVLPAADLAAQLETELVGIRAKAQIKGFRPGKAPLSHLRKIYGKSVMADLLQHVQGTAAVQVPHHLAQRDTDGLPGLCGSVPGSWSGDCRHVASLREARRSGQAWHTGRMAGDGIRGAGPNRSPADGSGL